MKPKLIILPGWSGTALWWQYQVNKLSDIADTEVMVITEHDRVEKMADAVLAQAPEKFILCGHSLGGWVAQHAAIKAPDRIEKLILIGSWTGVASLALKELYQQALEQINRGGVEALLAEFRPRCVDPARKNDVALMEMMRVGQAVFPKQGLINQLYAQINSQETSTLLQKIACRTLLIYGRQDGIFSLEDQNLILQKIKMAKLAIVEDAGHMLMLEQPQATTALIRLWVQL
jgi:pimeloyl-ACP methyl ester carboxylesterase